MQHSLIRAKNEEVKIFSHKDPRLVRKTLRVFSFSSGVLTDITPAVIPPIEDLNIGYYSTVITTPNENCHLLILFCGNPIVLRVGEPPLEFIYWGKPNLQVPYKHYNEFGDLLSDGLLQSLNYGFYFYTPVQDDLGYIEVNGQPNILSVPYSTGTAGISIDIDWQRSIIRQTFGIKVKHQNFELNTVNPIRFNLESKKYKFSLATDKKKFNLKTTKQKFKVYCKN